MPSPRRFRETLADPGAAAAHGRWLARGAWLLAAAEVVVAVRNHLTDRLTAKERKRMVEIVRSSKGTPFARSATQGRIDHEETFFSPT